MTTIGNALNLNFIANQLIYSPTATTLAGLNLPLTVPHGGTGLTTGSVPYTVICAGTTATGAFQPVPAIGPAGQVLTSNGPGALPNWQPGGVLTWAPVQTSNFNATSNTGYPVNTTSNPITATLPATPTVGNNIIFTDYAGTWNVNALTINPNGNKLEGSSSNYVINVSYGSVSIVFVDPIQGWLLYSSGNGIFNNVPANSALVSSGASVPNWNTTLPTAVQGNITSLGTISSIGAPLGAAFGGTGVTNGATSTITLGGPFTMSGAFSFTGTLTNPTAVTFPTSGTLATTSQIPAFPLSLANGGTNANLTASNGGIFYSTATAGAILSGTATANQVLLSGSSTTPAWSTATYPATTTINQVLYSNAANTITGLVTANTSCLTTNGSGVPGYTAYVSTGGSDGGTNNIVARDANGNTQFNNWTGATQGNAAVGTITLTAASPRNQVFSSGAGSAIMVLPDATTLSVGWEFTVNNNASGNITIETNGGATLFVAGPGSLYSIYLLTNSLPAGQWDWFANAPGNVTWTTAALNFGTNTNILTATWQGAAVGAAFGGTGVTNGATSTITLGGPFTMSGAFSFTGTLTNPTAVTFPTSGTLATTSQIPAFPLSLANGGTNANLTASNGGIFYSTATAGAILSGTATANQVLLSGSSTTPAWSTATYPATTTINQVLYSNAANTITGLATANTSCLTTNGSGVPSWNTTLPTAVQGNITSLGTISSIGAPLGAAFGGTGLTTTTTPYGVVCAGTSTTSALQVLNSLGSSGQLLTSNGPSALPSWQSVAGSSGRLLNVQVFTSGSGTYTATAGTNNIIVQCLAGGGGGGGAAATSGQLSAGGGGGAGGYSLLLVTGSSATYAYAVGAGGAGGAAGQNNGIVGGNSTFGTLITATGGGPGGAGPALSSSGLSGVGGAAGTSTGGNYNIAGGIGQWGYGIAGGASFPGTGGISIFGSGTFGLASFTTENGTASPANTGAGGSAGATFNSGAASGGDGGSGIIIVWEYT